MSLDAYDVAIDLIRTLRPILATLAKHDRDEAKQGRKAASSVSRNLKEGNRRLGRDRIHFFSIAAGSADEVLGVLDNAEAWGYLGSEETVEARTLLDRELAMLWRLTHARG